MADALFPGTFDPITLGHLDLIRRSARLFPGLVVGVGVNPLKAPLFSAEERVMMIHDLLKKELPRVEVVAFRGLLVGFARKLGVRCIIRGIRSGTDLDYEAAMAMTNRQIEPDIETLFLIPSPRFSHISSKLVREAVGLGADLRDAVPDAVLPLLRQRLEQRGDRP